MDAWRTERHGDKGRKRKGTEEEEEYTDHSQQVTSGWQAAVVRNLDSISRQVRQVRVLNGDLEPEPEGL